MTHPQEIDPDWARYPHTLLHFTEPARFVIDLRVPVTDDGKRQLASTGLNKPFAVITAHDPHGVDVSPHENRKRQAALEETLAAEHLLFVRVDACSPDRSHCECSVAAVIDQPEAIEIAKRFQQVAIFWFDGEAFWIFGGIVTADPIRLPRSS